MKALILNSGLGSRMGDRTKDKPKCMTEIGPDETILSRQLKILEKIGLKEIVITTGPFEETLKNYVSDLNLELSIVFVNNPLYRETNYIYSIYLAKEMLKDDLLLIHGDLVFTEEVVSLLLQEKKSGVIIDSSLPLPEKDFKAVIEGNKVTAIGIEFKDKAVACQPMYYLLKEEWQIWLDEIVVFCKNNIIGCYAENALNKVTNHINMRSVDLKGKLCSEIDCESDLISVMKYLSSL